MGAVGLFVHRTHEEAARLAREAADWLHRAGHEVRLLAEDAELSGLPRLGVEREDFDRGLSLAVSLGGDGTMLRTVDLVGDAGVPVLGVNLGHLGYLAEIEPAALVGALDGFFAGRHVVEERMRLQVAVEPVAGCPPGQSLVFPALNEAVVGKSRTGQIARVLVTIDGEAFTTYTADGVIAATATGSTAYAWSAGGPIMAPEHAAVLLLAVAPHMLFDRALVLPPTTCVRMEVVGDRPADLSVDGRNVASLARGDAVVCTAAARPARFVTFGRRSFLEILKVKFDMGDR